MAYVIFKLKQQGICSREMQLNRSYNNEQLFIDIKN